MKNLIFQFKILFLTLSAFNVIVSSEANNVPSSCKETIPGNLNQMTQDKFMSLLKSQLIIAHAAENMKKDISQESNLQKLKDFTKLINEFKNWQTYIQEQIGIIHDQTKMLHNNLLDSIKAEKDIALLIKKRGAEIIAEQQKLFAEINQGVGRDEEQEEKENVIDAIAIQSQPTEPDNNVSRNESRNSFDNLIHAAAQTSSALVNTKKRQGMSNKIETIPGLKDFINARLGIMSNTQVLKEWNESEVCSNNPLWQISRATLRRYVDVKRLKIANEEESYNAESDENEDELATESDEEILSKATTPSREERLNKRNSFYNIAQTQESSSSSSVTNSVHIGCNNEACELCKCTIHEILNLGKGNVRNVQNKISSCPDITKHTIDGVPLAAYILSNGSSSIWSNILSQLSDKFGLGIFNYADKDGNTTLHWLMKQPRNSNLIIELISKLNPNVRNLKGQTPLDYAIEHLSNNPDLDYAYYNFITNHIGCLIAYNKQLELNDDDIAKLKQLPDAVSSKRKKGLKIFTEGVLEKRNNPESEVADNMAMTDDQ